MAYERNFGVRTGLENRLATWANQLSMDNRFPWVGLGLIADLKCAAKQLGSDPEVMFPALRDPEPEEYDL